MYTLENSISDLQKDEFVWNHINLMFPGEFFYIVPKDLWDQPLTEVMKQVTMPWGIPFIGDAAVDSANALHEIAESDTMQFVPLWSETEEAEYFPEPENNKSAVCLLLLGDSFKEKRPIALCVPGGSYVSVAFANEGLSTGKELAKKGYAVAILNYRCSPHYYPAPQEDLALAIKYLRSHAKDLQVNGDDLMILGFSAGGHLCASEALYHEEADGALTRELRDHYPTLENRYKNISAKPDKVCLCYPVIDFVKEQHEESFLYLTGGVEALRDHLSVDRHVTDKYPKTFIWACADDSQVPPSNALRMHEALKAAGSESMVKIYPTGEHGCATAVGTSAEGWIDELVRFMKK